MIAITSVKNDQNGTSVTAVLAAVPTGPLTFYSSRTPEVQGSALPAGDVILIGVNTYQLTIADGSWGNQEIPWWITASDNTGTSAQMPVWVQIGTDDTLPKQIRARLRDLLLANKGLIDIRLKQSVGVNAQSIELMSVLAGMGEGVRKTPAIVIMSESLPEEFGLDVPMGAIVEPKLTLMCVHFHNGVNSYRETIEAMSWAVRSIINQYQNIELTLANGQVISRCTASIGQIEEYEGEKRYEVIAPIEFTCEVRVPHA